MSTLQQKYLKDVLPELAKNAKVKNPFALPRIKKIVVNIGVKEFADKKNMDIAKGILSEITGQKPKFTRAKQSIAGFKLRQGDVIGAMVTLRGRKMYDFLEKLIGVVLPRIRDFRGVPRTSFDGRGNYTLGFTEHTVFAEIDPGKVEKVFGLEVTIVTTGKSDEQALQLLTLLGMPFKKG